MSFDNSRGETFLYELARDGETTELIGYLKRGSSPVVRQRAAELLGDFADFPDEQRRDEIVQELLATVETADDEEVRAQAVDSLVRYGDDSLKRLIDRFSEFDASNAPSWVIADNLVEWFDDDRAEFRLVAATGLGWFGDEGALPALVGAFSDPDPRVRLRAVRSCGSIGDDRAVEALAGRLTDPDTRVQKEAASALGAIGTEKALDALLPAARNADPEVRQIALDELGQYGSLAPLVVLLEALEDASGPIRRTAIVSIIELFVHAPAGESHEMRSAVAERLEAIRPSDVVPQLVDILTESDRWAIRRNAVWLLGRLVDEATPPIQECLIDALDDEDETTAQLAATTLAELGGEGLEKRVLLFLQDIEEGSAAWNRGQFVLDRLGTDPEAELVSTGVNYTYVSDPEDYPRQDPEADQ
jgi:HEAT repeat protein